MYARVSFAFTGNGVRGGRDRQAATAGQRCLRKYHSRFFCSHRARIRRLARPELWWAAFCFFAEFATTLTPETWTCEHEISGFRFLHVDGIVGRTRATRCQMVNAEIVHTYTALFCNGAGHCW